MSYSRQFNIGVTEIHITWWVSKISVMHFGLTIDVVNNNNY